MIFDDSIINFMENIPKSGIFNFNDKSITTIMIVSLNISLKSLNDYFNDIIHNSSLNLFRGGKSSILISNRISFGYSFYIDVAV